MAANNEHEHEIKCALNEEHDVDVRAIGRWGIVLALTTILTLFGVWFYFDYLKKREAERAVAPRPLATPADARRLPPEPRLQSSPVADYQALRAAEDEVLNGYGWVDPDKGVVRIPIERAMELLAERGLPVRVQTLPAPGASVPTESGLGILSRQTETVTPPAAAPPRSAPPAAAAPHAEGHGR